MPHLAICRLSTRRLVALSSTTSTRRPASSGCAPTKSRLRAGGSSATGARDGEAERRCRGPGHRSRAHMRPPISSTRRRLIAKPEAGATVLARGRGIGLARTIGRDAHVFGRQADAGVAHGEGQLDCAVDRRARADRQHDLACVGELDRVRQQVEQDLPQPRDVAANGGGHVAFEHVGESRAASRSRAAQPGRAQIPRTRAGRTAATRCPCARPRSSRSRGCR